MTRVCLKCGFDNPRDVDFCEKCGEYLRWQESGASRTVSAEEEPRSATSTNQAASPESPATAADPSQTRPYGALEDGREAAPDRANSVLVTLSLPDRETRAGGEIAVSVDAGAVATLVALVRNQSGIVDNYDLSVEGLPEDWWSIAPATVYLVPYGAASGEYEQEVTVTFHPPRSSEADARVWPIRVVATSRANAAPAGDAVATLEIKPYHELEAEMRPETASGRRRARYAIALRNRANAAADVELSAVDPDGMLRFGFEKPRFSIEPGRRNGSVFELSVTKRMLFGRNVPRRFSVASTVIGSDVHALPKSGTFVQKPWIPAWAVVLGALAIIGAVAAYPLWPHPVTVPSLKGEEVFGAQQLLDQAGLELGNRSEKDTGQARPGTILAQTPAAGEKVDRGTAVSIQVAIATETAVVPNIVGLTLPVADRVLSKAELGLGAANPAPADPERSRILSQIPVAGVVAQKGSGVNVYFGVNGAGQRGDPSRMTQGAVASIGEAVVTAKAIAGEPGEGNVEVPDLAESTTAQASQALERARLTPVAGLLYTAEVPAGRLVTQSPEAGTRVAPWSTVAYFYATAYPELAFEADGDLLTMSGADGTRTGVLVKTPEIDMHPAWDPTGTRLAFRRGTVDQAGQIWLARRDGSQPAKQLTNAGFDDRRPAFSPDGTVIAFVRGSLAQRVGARDYDLCLVKVSGADAACMRDDATTVYRPAWAPSGRALVVASQASRGAASRELFAYTSSRPSSPDPADWRPVGPISVPLRPVRTGDAVFAAAVSPDGKTVALSANWGTHSPHLVLAAWNGRVLSSPREFRRIRSCELSWRPDGGELAVDQRGDTCVGKGMIVRFDPRHASIFPLTTAGANAGSPAWSPTA